MISVAICTYNGEKYINEQITSILNQTITPDEIVLCDDNSKDNTVTIAEKLLKNSGIKYKIHINKLNKGVTENFKKAISLCHNNIIFTSDQDDVWYPNKVEEIMEEFNKNKNLVLVFTNAELVDKNLNNMNYKLWDVINFKTSQLESKSYYDILLNRCIVTGATMAFKKELIQKIPDFSENWLHDGWIAINAPLYGDVKALDKSLIKYRQHENNVVGASKKSLLNKVKFWIKKINLIEDIRITRHSRYEDVYKLNNKILDENLKSQLRSCVYFWDDMIKLKYSNKLEGLNIILKNIKNNNYHKYYTGYIGAIRDIIYILIRRKTKVD